MPAYLHLYDDHSDPGNKHYWCGQLLGQNHRRRVNYLTLWFGDLGDLACYYANFDEAVRRLSAMKKDVRDALEGRELCPGCQEAANLQMALAALES